MKNLSDYEMRTINGGVPQAYYMDSDVIKAPGTLIKRGLSLLRDYLSLWAAIN